MALDCKSPPKWKVVARWISCFDHQYYLRAYSYHTTPIFYFLPSTQPFLSDTVAEGSKACTVFARSEARIVGSNRTQGTDVWCVYAFILCLCCPVYRQGPCDELITRPRSPTVCKWEISPMLQSGSKRKEKMHPFLLHWSWGGYEKYYLLGHTAVFTTVHTRLFQFSDPLNFFNVWLQYMCKHYSGALVRQRTIPTEGPPLVGEVSANFSG
jgi:hypothetical protein